LEVRAAIPLQEGTRILATKVFLVALTRERWLE